MSHFKEYMLEGREIRILYQARRGAILTIDTVTRGHWGQQRTIHITASVPGFSTPTNTTEMGSIWEFAQ